MDTWQEWQTRKQLLDEVLKTLSDGKRRRGREIARELKKRGIEVEKSLVNNLLFSEGRRYVTYDRASYTYQLKGKPFVVSERQQSGDEVEVSHLAASAVEFERRYTFSSEFADSTAFFRPEARGGKTLVAINRAHPFSRKLVSLALSSDARSQVLYQKYAEAIECIRVLLKAWSDYENEQPEGKRKFMVQEARAEWGRKLRNLLIE